MRLLADENFPKPIVEALRSRGHDVLWARTDCAGWKDVTLLDLAESENRSRSIKTFGRLRLLCSEFIRQHRRISSSSCGRLLRRIGGWAGHIRIIAPDGIQMLAARKS